MYQALVPEATSIVELPKWGRLFVPVSQELEIRPNFLSSVPCPTYAPRAFCASDSAWKGVLQVVILEGHLLRRSITAVPKIRNDDPLTFRMSFRKLMHTSMRRRLFVSILLAFQRSCRSIRQAGEGRERRRVVYKVMLISFPLLAFP